MSFRHALPNGARAVLTLPEGSDAHGRMPSFVLPLSGLPAERSFDAGYVGAGDGVALSLTCAEGRGLGRIYEPGFEELVLPKLTEQARRGFEAGGEPPARWTTRPVVSLPPLFEHRAAGVSPAGPDRALASRQVLGFAGESREPFVCAALCAGPEPACAAWLAGLTFEGLSPPPPPGLASRVLTAGFAHPALAAAFALAAVLGVTAWILGRR